MAKEYIEKKAVMGAIDRLESENNCGTSDFIESKRIAYKQVTEAINSLPTQEDKSDAHLLDMLLEAINYVYKQLDGKYGNLSYVVSDKVKYIERVRAEKIEQKKHEEFEARERGYAKAEVDLEAVKDAYCDVCGHFHHTTPHYICRLDCLYYTDFINRLNPKHK